MLAGIQKIIQSLLPQPVTAEQSMAAASKIEAIIGKAGGIAIFSKTDCPYVCWSHRSFRPDLLCHSYCSRAKGILSAYSGMKPRLQVLELNTMGSEGQAIQDALAKKLGKGRVTVPQVCY